jgi:hypothetical protein
MASSSKTTTALEELSMCYTDLDVNQEIEDNEEDTQTEEEEPVPKNPHDLQYEISVKRISTVFQKRRGLRSATKLLNLQNTLSSS